MPMTKTISSPEFLPREFVNRAQPASGVAKDTEGAVGASAPPVALGRYLREVELTDQLPATELNPVLMGLFGEVGGILTTLKKRVRDQESYPDYGEAVEEDFGRWDRAARSAKARVTAPEIQHSSFDKSPVRGDTVQMLGPEKIGSYVISEKPGTT